MGARSFTGVGTVSQVTKRSQDSTRPGAQDDCGLSTAQQYSCSIRAGTSPVRHGNFRRVDSPCCGAGCTQRGGLQTLTQARAHVTARVQSSRDGQRASSSSHSMRPRTHAARLWLVGGERGNRVGCAGPRRAQRAGGASRACRFTTASPQRYGETGIRERTRPAWTH